MHNLCTIAYIQHHWQYCIKFFSYLAFISLPYLPLHIFPFTYIGEQDKSLQKSEECEKESEKTLKVLNPSDIEFNEFILLREKFKDLSETYTEHTVDKDGLASIVDKMSDQPIFFLATPIDEITDFMKPTNRSESPNSRNDLSEICYDSSDSEDIPNLREEDTKDKIYTLATEQTIHSLIFEYKKRKNQHSMPSRLKEKLSRKTSSGSRRRNESSGSSVPEDIAIQRRNSIMKVSIHFFIFFIVCVTII